MTLNPKTRFQAQDALAKQHLDISASEAFQRAAESALLQMVMEIPSPKDQEQAAANWYAMAGARAYVNLLLNIAEKPQPPAKTSTHNLDHGK